MKTITHLQKMQVFLAKSLAAADNSHWKTEDFVSLTLKAAESHAYLEDVRGGFPSADTFHLRTERRNLCEFRDSFFELTKPILRSFKEAVVMIDVTEEPFYGRKKNEWIHGFQPLRGTTGCYKFMTVFVLIGSKRFFVDAIPLNVWNIKEEVLDEILSRITREIRVKRVLLDREFYSSEVIKMLEKHRVKYQILVPKNEGVKKILERTTAFKRLSYNVNGVQTNLVVIKKEITKDGRFDWVFCTNCRLGKVSEYITSYKSRWNIETGFRVGDEAKIKSKSKNILTRYCLFLISLILYNLWKVFEVKIPFKRFLIQVCRGITAFISEPRFIFPKLNSSIPPPVLLG